MLKSFNARSDHIHYKVSIPEDNTTVCTFCYKNSQKPSVREDDDNQALFELNFMRYLLWSVEQLFKRKPEHLFKQILFFNIVKVLILFGYSLFVSFKPGQTH